MQSKDVARAVILTALAVALSPFFIPVGIAKCFPAQHMVNVLSAVMLGLGTLLAFPGGMIGALLAGVAYRLSGNIYLAGAGEVCGTGLLGALVSAWIIGPLLMGKSMALLTLVIAFSISTLGGSILAIVALHVLRKAKVWRP